jgi:hypothetical protein
VGKPLYQLKIRSNKNKIKWEMVKIKLKIESENPPIIVDQKDGAILTTFSTTRLDSKKGKDEKVRRMTGDTRFSQARYMNFIDE